MLCTKVPHEELTLHFLANNPELVLSSSRDSDTELHTGTISSSSQSSNSFP